VAGLKWKRLNRLKFLSYFANLEGKLSSLQVRKTWLWLILVRKRRGGGQQVGIGLAAAAVYGPVAGLLFFLV
jgi:hypothetical protein